MGISPRKNLCNKRRLSLFLFLKNQAGTEIKLNIFKFMRDVLKMADKSGPKCRLVLIVATIQKSSSSWRSEGKQIYKIFKIVEKLYTNRYVLCLKSAIYRAMSRATSRVWKTMNTSLKIYLHNKCGYFYIKLIRGSPNFK